MISCVSCGEFIYERETVCPFCDAGVAPRAIPARIFRLAPSRRGRRSSPGFASISFSVLAAVFSPIILAACYGAPAEDLDNDGYDSFEDCNDNDASIHPDATEDCEDQIDNNCNGLVDLEDPLCGASPSPAATP